MENPYALPTIQKQIDEILKKRNEALSKLSDLDIPGDLKFHLSDAIYKYYQPTLSQLALASDVAQWYVSQNA